MIGTRNDNRQVRIGWPGWAAAALVALGAAACQSTGIRATQTVQVADSSDQFMTKMTTNMVENGVRTGYVYAESAYVYQMAQRMDLRQMRVLFFEDGKQTSVLTAEQGDYNIGNGSLDARGNVRIESTDGRRLTTPHLIYDRTLLQLRSDTIFVYDSRGERLTGKSFTSDLEFKNVRIVEPKGVQRRGGFDLPGQKPDSGAAP